jgi:hypothetical protein
MPVGQESKSDLDSDDDVAQQQDDDTQQDDADEGDDASAATEAEEESAKEEIHPALTVTSPGSGAQFQAGDEISVEFDCEGDVEFSAHVAVVDAAGSKVLEDQTDLKLEEGKGHGTLSVGGDAMVAGRYDVLVWGESNGEATAIQKLQIEIVDTEAEEEPEPVVAVEGDDGDSDDLSA